MLNEKLIKIYERNKILREPRWRSYCRREVNKGTCDGIREVNNS